MDQIGRPRTLLYGAAPLPFIEALVLLPMETWGRGCHNRARRRGTAVPRLLLVDLVHGDGTLVHGSGWFLLTSPLLLCTAHGALCTK